MGSCADLTARSCKQAFLLASDGMTERGGRGALAYKTKKGTPRVSVTLAGRVSVGSGVVRPRNTKNNPRILSYWRRSVAGIQYRGQIRSDQKTPVKDENDFSPNLGRIGGYGTAKHHHEMAKRQFLRTSLHWWIGELADQVRPPGPAKLPVETQKVTPAQPHGGVFASLSCKPGREFPAILSSLASDFGGSLPARVPIPPVVSSCAPADALHARTLPRSHAVAIGCQEPCSILIGLLGEGRESRLPLLYVG